ncbi:15-hydroxyprostaglandin dehydrogenase [NAD(+)]-like [Battus philenor]|uniref:15-hydroxyprostaglandin dehydrogenase [NAD(+)]-like n=1 Tax=Battus philenor TaxID=42288 RepID=UPI0035CFC98F
MYEIKDKVFLITGAAGGIGAEIARTVLEQGAKHVVGLDIDAAQGTVLECELNNIYGLNKMKFIPCDITTQLDDVLEEALKVSGYIDVVINNAGIMNDHPNVYLKEIAVNVTALITISYKALGWMRTDRGGKGGTIINVSSIVGLIQSSLLPVYSATKSAVLQFSNCFGHQENFSLFGTRVIAICFGVTDTSLLSRKKIGGFTEEIEENLITAINGMPLQSTKSAVQGLLEAYKKGSSGSTWLVTSNRPAEEITENVNNAYKILGQGIFDSTPK